MVKNYFKIAWRSLWKNNLYSAINISGLAVGLATGIMLLLWVQNELSYDKFNKDYQHIYQLSTHFKLNGENVVWKGVPGPLAVFAGLFGLSCYAVQQRVKEIGIRKVLGASVSNIVFALSKDFIRLTIVAIVIAFPITWFATNKWLQDFSYRTDINYSIYMMTAIATVSIAITTVSLQAIKAAIANPVKSLRTE
jgi:putative ABC transport system permease protein